MGEEVTKRRVECYAGACNAERPRALVWNGERVEIGEIIKSWRTPNEKCFRVSTVIGRTFELHYSEITDAWSVHPI